MAVIDRSNGWAKGSDAFSPRTVADRLTTLLKSLDGYNLLSNGVFDEIMEIVPGGAASIRDLDDDAIAATWFKVVNVLRQRRLEPVLSLHGLPYPRYPVGRGEENSGTPLVTMWDPSRLPDASPSGWSVLGFDIGFPVGIPSCELTANADWIEYYARKGFHLLTYRTVRNRPRVGSPYDWVFLADIRQPWAPDATPSVVRHAEGPIPPDVRTISTATSYLAPCPPPEVWEADVREARRRLDELGGHHLLIVSVTDSVPLDQKRIETLRDDFVEVALRAESAGAQAIECYLARATTRGDSGELARCERSVETSIAIVEAVRAALKEETRLLVKFSADLSNDNLEEIVVHLAKNRLIDGISGISPVEVERVTTGHDEHPLWQERRPGVAGYALRDLSRDFVTRLASIRSRHNLEFDIIAMGGITTPDDVASYMALGASAVQTATAAVCDPGLAEAAYTRYKASVRVTEDWDGVVIDVDDVAGTFWARVTRADAITQDMDACFEMEEVHPDQRRDIRAGALFRWTTGLIEEGRRLVRQSSVRFERLEPPTEEAIATGKDIAERAARTFGEKPEAFRPKPKLG